MQPQRPTPLPLLVLCVFILSQGCADDRSVHRTKESLPPLTGVQVEEVKAREIPDTLEAVGTVRSVQHTTFSARMVAHVTAIRVQVGEQVQAGQPLLELDAREVQSHLRQAQAGLAESRDALVEVEQSLQAAQ